MASERHGRWETELVIELGLNTNMNVEVTTAEGLIAERCTDGREWDEFLVENDGSAYALWGWGDAAETYGHDRWYLAVRRSGEIVGVLPLFHIESRLFSSALVSPAYATSAGMLIDDDEPQPKTVAELLVDRTRTLADELGVDFVSLRGVNIDPAGIGDTEAWITDFDGLELKRRFVTFRTPLEDEPDDVWNRLKESRRRQIRQADDLSLTYEVGDTLEDLREFYHLYLVSMRGHGTPPHSYELFRTLFERLHDDGHLRLGLVRNGGAIINGILDVALGSTVYQWSVVNDYEYRELNGGSLALWESLKWASENGYEAYEFGRTREGSGVYMFKRSFGGEKTWYDDVHYFPHSEASLPHPEDDTYDRAKDVWRKLPLPVTRAVGPRIRRNISL